MFLIVLLEEPRINRMTVKPHFSIFSEIQVDRECHRVNCNILGELFLLLMSEYATCSDNYIFEVRRGGFLRFGQ